MYTGSQFVVDLQCGSGSRATSLAVACQGACTSRLGMINRLFTASRLLSATSSYSYSHKAWLPKELATSYKLLGCRMGACMELATAVCSWLHARQCCLPAAP